MTSLYFLPRKKEIDLKAYMSSVASSSEKFSVDASGTVIFLDNGAFSRILHGKKLPTPKELADELSNRIQGADFVAAGPDVPVNLTNLTMKQKERNARLTVKNMEDFISYYSGRADPVAVIQAMGAEMALNQAKRYAELGYKTVALGTMGRAVTSELLEQSKIIGRQGLRVHVFGATPPRVLPLLNYYSVEMVDSHSPLRWSMYGMILDGRDYTLRRVNEVDEATWNCQCPVCTDRALRRRVLEKTPGDNPSPRRSDIRAVHNYLMLKKAAHDSNLRSAIFEAQHDRGKFNECLKCRGRNNDSTCALLKFREQCPAKGQLTLPQILSTRR
jgi:queuine/archaeosine tRNA-ribosyltransferase